MSEENIKIKVSVSTNKVKSLCESFVSIEAEDWNEMSEDEREEFCRDEMFQMIDWNYEIVD